MGDLVSAARSLAKSAVTMAVTAGQTPHLTAITNARTALADARRRAEARQEVAALFASDTTAGRSLEDSDATPRPVATGSPGSGR